jgi:SAM-dependent methyltransferase
MYGWKNLDEYDFRVVLLLESKQLEWMLEWKDQKSIGLLMNHYPTVAWYLKNKAPKLKKRFEELEDKYKTIDNQLTLKEIERAFIDSLEDWLIYVIDPDAYDRLSFNQWADNEMLDLISFSGKIVLDIGSGTGSQLFRIAPYAKTCFSVEPVEYLRQYLREKAQKSLYNNVFVSDGLITELPFPDDMFDVVVSGHVFGDYPKEELAEMTRVVKDHGMIILMPGNHDEDNHRHQFLTESGFLWDRFLEPGPDKGHGWKRKYWKECKKSS